MCYFITIGLPEEKTEYLEQHVPRGFHIAPVANASVLSQMVQGFRSYVLMSGGCSCDLFREPRTETEADRDAHARSAQKQLRHKYEKIGWSEAKIDRALSQRAKGRRPETFVGLRGDVQRFLGAIATTVGHLAVMVHWYDGDVEEPQIACKQGESIKPETLLEEGLRIGVDEIVYARRG